MMDLNQMANEAFRITSPDQLEWWSFGIKALYIVIYGGITYQLLSAAQRRIGKSKEGKGSEGND